jgi:hypothetical protein
MRLPIRLAPIVAVAAMVAAAGSALIPGVARADLTVWQCQTYQPSNSAPLFSGGNNTDGTTITENYCQGGDGLDTIFKSAPYGYGAWWFIDAPSGWLTIAEARVWYRSYCPKDGMSGQFAWNDYGQNAGSAGLCGGSYFDQTFSSPVSSFGWRHWCAQSGGCSYLGGTPYPELSSIQGVWLDVHDGASPTVGAVGGGPKGNQNLWWHGGGWVRGSDWPVDLVGGDITGVCQWTAAVDGNWIARQWDPPDQTQWHQCDHGDTGGTDQYGDHQQRWSATIDTASISDGWHSYEVGDQNAAGNWTSPGEQIGVDNSPVSLSLTGASHDASVTSGTQYVTATVSSGPSGVGAIYCTDNGGSPTSEPLSGGGTETATAEVPVSGLGEHSVSCSAVNRALDANNSPASSPSQSWQLKIGEPVSAHISLARVRRVCRSVRVHRHHRSRRVVRCHTATRELHLERVPFGHRATVSGWLQTAGGNALGGVPVSVLAAPDNGSYAWRRVAVVTTDGRGEWRATLAPGPSRLIQAVYTGGPVTEGATSAEARTVVAAKVRLAQLPARVPWGGVLVIRGSVLGGYIPPEQILQVLSGVGKHLQILGNPYIHRSGRFLIRMAATGSGGPLHTQIAVATLRETNYPYARGVSRRAWVTIG